MANFKERKRQQSGMVLGGIGTGSLELFPDGELHEWQIYNTPRWAKECRESKVDDGEGFTGALSFFLRTEDKKNGRLLRRLGFHTSSEEFTYRMFTAVKPVEEIDFDCRFPTATLAYHDSDLPVAVTGCFTSPFVPHQETLTATPAFAVTFTVENPNDRKVKASLCAKLKTDFCNQAGQEHHIHPGKTTYLAITPKETASYNDGSLALSVFGDGKTSYIAGDYTRYLDEYVSHSPYGITQESFLFPFLETGSLPNTKAKERLSCGFFTFRKPELKSVVDDRLATLREYPFSHSLLKRLEKVIPGYLNDYDEKLDFLKVCQRQVADISRDHAIKPFGGAALCHKLTLQPHEKKTVTFLFSWYFPNHIGEEGRVLGHYYENLFSDALGVNRFARKNYEKIFTAAQSFSRLLYDTTLPDCYPDAWSSHLSTLVKDSWWLKDGSFGLWEGFGFCGFATTDITYHASFSLAALFPALQKRQMAMTAAFQREDGRMPHFFTPDLYHVDNGFHRVDMNPQYVLLAARDYLLDGDLTHLKKLYPHIVAAMEATNALDGNGDGLPDTHTAFNTYDAWHFEGTPSYIAFLWLSALTAAITLAEAVGDSENKKKWQALLEKGKASLETLLYNGKYYDLWAKDSGEKDKCLMSNQLDGEGFLRLIGLTPNLPASRYTSVLRYIYQNNFKKGEGLVNATCPKDHLPTVYTYQNCQAEARWTGIAYLFAAALDTVGEESKAKEIIETVHECQRRLGLFFNHWECGFRYTRPLSSWATLLASSGFTFDCARGKLSLLPPSKTKEARYPLVTSHATATASFTSKHFSLTIKSGSLTLSTLALPKEVGTNVTLTDRNGNTLPLGQKARKGRVTLFRFAHPITLTQGETLSIE